MRKGRFEQDEENYNDTLQINGHVLQKVNSFNNLGVLLPQNNNEDRDHKQTKFIK